jgi:zinc protease
VQSDKTKESLDELNKEFRGIVGNRPPVAAELQRAQNSMTLKLPGSRETIDAVGSSILEQVQFGLPDDYYATFAQKVRSLGVPAVTDAAKSTIRPDNLVWVVVGDRAKIEAGIRQLGLGEVKFLDANGNPL